MMFLYILRFDLEEQEAQLLEKFFSRDKMEAVKEEKDKKLNKVKVELISDTEEPDNGIDNKIEVEEASSTTIKDYTKP